MQYIDLLSVKVALASHRCAPLKNHKAAMSTNGQLVFCYKIIGAQPPRPVAPQPIAYKYAM